MSHTELRFMFYSCGPKILEFEYKQNKQTPWLSPQTNYTDIATAACRRS
jgi:hypothetical protein